MRSTTDCETRYIRRILNSDQEIPSGHPLTFDEETTQMNASTALLEPRALATWMKVSDANANALDTIFDAEVDDIKVAAFSSDCCGSNNYEDPR